MDPQRKIVSLNLFDSEIADQTSLKGETSKSENDFVETDFAQQERGI